MGPTRSASKSVSVPDNYRLIKISSFDIDLENSIRLRRNVERIVDYTEKQQIDIVCLHSIRDRLALKNLVKHFRTVSKMKNVEIFTSPEYDDEDDTPVKRTLFVSQFKTKRNDKQEKHVPTLIVSRFPVHSYCVEEMNSSGGYSLVANIRIDNRIVSMIGVTLTKDIESVGFSNQKKREKEMLFIRSQIQANSKQLKESDPNSVSDISLLMGNMHTPEMTENGDMTDEYAFMVETLNTIDLFRHKNETDPGYTTITNRRDNYTLFVLTPDIFEEGTSYNEELMNVETSEDMFRFLFKRYTFHCIDVYVNSSFTFLRSMPTETMFMIETKGRDLKKSATMSK